MALQPEVELVTDEQKVSYGFGLQFGDQLRKNSFDGLELDAVIAGIQHWYNDQQAAMSDADLNPSYQVIQQKQQAKAAELGKAIYSCPTRCAFAWSAISFSRVSAAWKTTSGPCRRPCCAPGTKSSSSDFLHFKLEKILK